MSDPSAYKKCFECIFGMHKNGQFMKYQAANLELFLADIYFVNSITSFSFYD